MSPVSSALSPSYAIFYVDHICAAMVEIVFLLKKSSPVVFKCFGFQLHVCKVFFPPEVMGGTCFCRTESASRNHDVATWAT